MKMFFKFCMQSAKEVYEQNGRDTAIGCFVIILALFLGLTLSFAAACFCGWLFMILYNWFAVTYLGVEAINYWLCVGIVFALDFFFRFVFGLGKE